jgi:oligoendopeptidase F
MAHTAPDTTIAQERDRTKIPDQYTWNLADIYPSDAAWKEAKQRLITEIPAIGKYQSTLESSAQQLLGCLDLVTDLNKEFSRLYSYEA